MLWAMAIILGTMWALAMLSSYQFGGFVHVLLAAAIVMGIYQIFKNHRWDRPFKKGT